MKALVFSDSHGNLNNLLEVLRLHPDYEAIFHLGDVESDENVLRSITPYPVYMVKGNCDYYSSCQEKLVFEWQGKKIVMCHGHRYLNYGNGLDNLRYLAQQENADLVMFGHTHVPFLEEVDGCIYLNPGSISKPRQAKKIPTYTVIEVSKDGKFHFEMFEFASK